MFLALTICGHADGYAIRLVEPTSDDLLGTYRSFDAAAAAHAAFTAAARDALPALAATLAKPSHTQA